MNTEIVSLYCAENDTLYQIRLSREEADRAKRDPSFASGLLKQVMETQVTQPSIPLVDIGSETSGHPADNPNSIEEFESSVLTAGHSADNLNVSVEEDADEQDSDASLYRWATPAVLLLLDLYNSVKEQLSSGKTSHKKVWEIVASLMKEKGHNVTEPQCAAKMRSLKKTYKSVKDHNNKSGNNRRTWQFFETMDEIFSGAAWCQPVALASSTGVSTAAERPIGVPAQKSGCSSQLSDSGCDEDTPSKKITPADLLGKRLRQKEKSEEEKAKRHRERMELEERRLALDSKLVAILENLSKKTGES